MKKKIKINPDSTDTYIGEGSVFEGKITSKAGISIQGKMLGDIECTGDVTIEKNGEATSNISARNAIISGTAKGSVLVQGTLTITSTGKLFGNTTTKSLVIAEGAVFQGNNKMRGDDNNSSTNTTNINQHKQDQQMSIS